MATEDESHHVLSFTSLTINDSLELAETSPVVSILSPDHETREESILRLQRARRLRLEGDEEGTIGLVVALEEVNWAGRQDLLFSSCSVLTLGSAFVAEVMATYPAAMGNPAPTTHHIHQAAVQELPKLLARQCQPKSICVEINHPSTNTSQNALGWALRTLVDPLTLGRSCRVTLHIQQYHTSISLPVIFLSLHPPSEIIMDLQYNPQGHLLPPKAVFDEMLKHFMRVRPLHAMGTFSRLKTQFRSIFPARAGKTPQTGRPSHTSRTSELTYAIPYSLEAATALRNYPRSTPPKSQRPRWEEVKARIDLRAPHSRCACQRQY